MIINRTIISTLLAIGLLYGCKNHNESSNITIKDITIDVTLNKSEVDISHFLENTFEIIALETDEKCLISSPQRVIFNKDWILIADKLTQSIHLFNRNGKHIRTIGRKGRGPGEYSKIVDLCVINDSIYVADRYNSNIIRYSINGGSGTTLTIPEEMCFSEMIPIGDQIGFVAKYTNCEPKNFNFLYFDTNKREITPALPFDDKITNKESVWGLNKYTSQYKDTTLLTLPTNDTIYSITKNNITPLYTIKFSDKNLPQNLKEKDASEIIITAMEQGYIKGVEDINNAKELLFFNYIEGENSRSVVYDKNSNKYQIGEWLTVDKLGGLYCTSYATTSNDEFIVIQNANMFKNVWNGRYSRREFENPSDKTKMQTAADKIDANSNPIIFRFKLKPTL